MARAEPGAGHLGDAVGCPRQGRRGKRDRSRVNALRVIQAGTVPYQEALEWQRELAEDRIAGRLSHDVLLLLEHPPVVTLGRNSRAAHLLQPVGIEVFEVERDRLEQMRGAGQLVGYPILDHRAYKQ